MSAKDSRKTSESQQPFNTDRLVKYFQHFAEKIDKNASVAGDLSKLLKLLNYVLSKFDQHAEVAGPVIVDCIALYETLAVKHPEQSELDLANITAILCSFSERCMHHTDENIVHPKWLRSWYNLARRASDDVRLEVFKTQFNNFQKCVSYILECGYYRNQLTLMKIILVYTGVKYRENNVDLPALFIGQHENLTDIDTLHQFLDPLNTYRVELCPENMLKCLRSFLNHLNRTTTHRVVSCSIRFVYFDGTYIDLYPDDSGWIDFNRGVRNMEFVYMEDDGPHIAIIDDDNLKHLNIKKQNGEYNMTFTMENALRIRSPKGDLFDDSHGINKISIVFNSHFAENEIDEIFGNMIPGKYVEVKQSQFDEIEMMPIDDLFQNLRERRSENQPLGPLTPTMKSVASQPPSPETPVDEQRKIRPRNIKAQIHQQSCPSPELKEQPRHLRPKPVQTGLYNIEEFSSEPGTLGDSKAAPIRKSPRIASKRHNETKTHFTDVCSTDPVELVDEAGLIDPLCVEEPVSADPAQPSQNKPESIYPDCTSIPDDAIVIDVDDLVPFKQPQKLPPRASMMNVLDNANDATKTSECQPRKIDRPAHLSASIGEQAKPAAVVDTFEFVDEDAAGKRKTAKPRKATSKAAATEKPKRPPKPPKSKWSITPAKPKKPAEPKKTAKTVPKMQLKRTPKHSQSNDDDTHVKPKRGRTLFDPYSYNDTQNYTDENVIAVQSTKLEATQRKKDWDQLTTSSFDSIIMKDPKQQSLRVSNNVMRINKSLMPTSALMPIDANVVHELDQLRAAQPSRTPRYSYRAATTTTTTTTLVTASQTKVNLPSHSQKVPDTPTLDTFDTVEVETVEQHFTDLEDVGAIQRFVPTRQSEGTVQQEMLLQLKHYIDAQEDQLYKMRQWMHQFQQASTQTSARAIVEN